MTARRIQSSKQELLIAEKLAALGHKFEIDISVTSEHLPAPNNQLSGTTTPDFLFRDQRIAVFYDGCYWHECPDHYPNAWGGKTRAKDQRQDHALHLGGWTVVRHWEHEGISHVVEAIDARISGRDIPAPPLSKPRPKKSSTPKAKGITPHRPIRIKDELWEPFRETAKAQGTDASTLIRAFIAQWLEDHKEQP